MDGKKHIRDVYFDLTGDAEGAYGTDPRNTEEFVYSDATIQRAIDMLGEQDPMGERPFMVEQIQRFGPRAGATAGLLYQMTPEAGEGAVADAMADFDHYRGLEGSDKYAKMAKSGLIAAGNAMSPIPTRQYGAMKGLINYFMGD